MIGRPCKTCPHSGPLQGNWMARLSAAFALIVVVAHGGMLQAHPGHEHSEGLRRWKDLKRIVEVEASFVCARDDTVQLRKDDGTLVWVPRSLLSTADQEWVQERVEEIR